MADIPLTDLVNAIVGLDPSRYERARANAEQQIKQSISEPDKRQYMGRGLSKYPPIVRNGALVALAFVALAMFWISAGKLLVSADMTLKPLIRDYADRLTPAWLNTAILVFLAGGEIGTLVFMVGRSIVARTDGEKRWLAIAALACAALAIVANVSITALHPGDIQSIAVFGWLMAVIPPAIVLAVGLFIERLLIGGLEMWAEAQRVYKEDYAAWERVQRDPTAHTDYRRMFYLQLLDQLQRVSPANRKKIESAVEIDPDVRRYLIVRELQRHEWASTVQTAFEQSGSVGADYGGGSLINVSSLNNGPVLRKALEYLAANPEQVGLSVRELAIAAGVSIGTMAKARQSLGNE